MNKYLVGGAVRDLLLGHPVKDHDYVVVGSSTDEMLALGYKQVGADFPVFLHPESGCEHALARTERKSGVGYHGFVVNADPSVTLEDDLRRRDLTINSMALSETGEIIDPFSGQLDLKNGILRHTSEAFAEDPLRVLRVARFAARYQFNVAFETLTLMRKLVECREMETLTTERVWLELEKAMMEKAPSRFIVTLWRCEAWDRLFPEINSGAGIHILNAAVENKLSFHERLAALFAETHLDKVDNLLTRFKTSAELTRLVHNVWKVRQLAGSIGMSHFRVDPLGVLKSIDAFRRSEGLKQVCNVLRCFKQENLTTLALELEIAHGATAWVSFDTLSPDEQKLTGAAIGKAIDEHRQKILNELTFTS